MKIMAFFRCSASSLVLAVVTVLAYTTVQAEEHGEHSEHHSPHVGGLFLGATIPEEGSTEITIGAEYEYRINEMFGVGGIVEYTPEAEDGEGAGVAVAALHIHPMERLRLTVGGGMEFVDSEEKDDEPLFRIGAAYDIELGNNLAIAPTVALDFVDGDHAVVVGATLSTHF